MRYIPATIYRRKITGLQHLFTEAIERGLAQRNGPAVLFFRADDIGVPSQMFQQMILLFQKHAMPLNLATVPAWLTESRWRNLQRLAADEDLFCWHQHGWRHVNHEASGRKQEFGDSRRSLHLKDDLLRGRHRLSSLMGDRFLPLFTPPWNRCGSTTLSLLKEYGYRGMSRHWKALPPPPPGLVDIPVNVDLHTRREKDCDFGLNALLKELQDGVASGIAGVMIHHQRMNDHAVHLLDELLLASRHPGLAPRSFTGILQNETVELIKR